MQTRCPPSKNLVRCPPTKKHLEYATHQLMFAMFQARACLAVEQHLAHRLWCARSAGITATQLLGSQLCFPRLAGWQFEGGVGFWCSGKKLPGTPKLCFWTGQQPVAQLWGSPPSCSWHTPPPEWCFRLVAEQQLLICAQPPPVLPAVCVHVLQVVFAGYRIPHPLNPMMVVRIQTTEQSNPPTAMMKTIDQLRAEVGQLQAQLDQAAPRDPAMQPQQPPPQQGYGGYDPQYGAPAAGYGGYQPGGGGY